MDTTTGAVTFLDSKGTTVLAEQPGGGRTLTSATIQGEATHNVRQEWQPQSDESLYGLGQHQQGHFDIKGYDLDLHQQNSEVFIPYLVSSRGYGILWDNTSFTRFGDLGQPQHVPGVTYASGAGTPANTVQGASSGSVNWQGMVTAPTTGDYEFFTYASGNVQLDINNQTLVNHWRQNWLPNVEIAKVTLQAGQQVPVHLQWTADSGVNLLQFGWKTPPATPRTTSLWSEVGDGIDYYFVYGPEMDDVVAGYRRLTGQAPMMPRWAFGFWQSREHYASSDDITSVLSGYRTRNAPIDAIVQDWQYWVPNGWGTHQFDPARYPDPKGLITSIHKTYNAHFMISVWGKFYTNTDNYKALAAKNYVFHVQRHGRRHRLRRVPVQLLRRVQPRRARHVLVADQRSAVQPGRRRLVDGRFRTGDRRGRRERQGGGAVQQHRLADRDQHRPHEPELSRHGRAHAQRVFAR